MKNLLILIVLLYVTGNCIRTGEQRVPLKENPENALIYNWPFKTVHDSLMVDDMENMSGWSSGGGMTVRFTEERSIDGKRSLQMEADICDTVNILASIKRNGLYDGTTSYSSMATRTFSEPQDWSDYNRISLWIYVHPEADGVQDRVALMFDCLDIPTHQFVTPRALNYLHTLKAGQWNRVFWEFPEIPRDKIIRFSVRFVAENEGFGKTGVARFDIDRIQLQRVDVDKKEGWQTIPGKIAFCHIGYTPGEEKIAVSNSINTDVFQLVNESGSVVLEKPFTVEKNSRGTYQILDFSELTTPGKYFIKAGEITTRTFRIADDVWNSPIRKALNFFFVERCGYEVPGVHGVCHQDWRGTANGDTAVINGGWHDAGDMCQGAQQTGLTIYAMLELASQMAARGNDPELLELVEEEAAWGLEYWLKTRFPNGYRVSFSVMRIYTDNKTGTIDDVISQARNTPWINFLGSAIESYAARIFSRKDPELAARCKKAAQEDWEIAMASLPEGWETRALTGDPPLSRDLLLLASWGAVSSLNLYQLNGEAALVEKAAAFGRIILSCQETKFVQDIPVTGYFYTSPEKKNIVHFTHFAFEESPLLALTNLCETLPDHEEWIQWYGAIVMHSEYFMKRGAEYSSPFYMIPSSVYRKSEILNSNAANEFGRADGAELTDDVRAVLLKQVEEGERLSEDYYLRKFPVQVHRQAHGSTAIQLSESVALALASRLRNDSKGQKLVTRQMEWVLGANPFSQSIMYGEGYDYAPLYAASAGNIVGALPVGVDCMSNDEPHWYSSNHMTPKEIWVVPTGRFLWNMAYAGTPSLLKGSIKGKVKALVINGKTGEQIPVTTTKDGSFSMILQPGEYKLQYGEGWKEMNLIKGGSYSVTCDPAKYIHIKAYQESGSSDNRITITAKIKGMGSHIIRLLCLNGSVNEQVKTVELEVNTEKTVSWDINVTDPDKPWVAVIVPDNDINEKTELTGTN